MADNRDLSHSNKARCKMYFIVAATVAVLYLPFIYLGSVNEIYTSRRIDIPNPANVVFNFINISKNEVNIFAEGVAVLTDSLAAWSQSSGEFAAGMLVGDGLRSNDSITEINEPERYSVNPQLEETGDPDSLGQIAGMIKTGPVPKLVAVDKLEISSPAINRNFLTDVNNLLFTFSDSIYDEVGLVADKLTLVLLNSSGGEDFNTVANLYSLSDSDIFFLSDLKNFIKSLFSNF